MRRDQLAASLRPYLAPALGHPNVCALVAPATPRSIPGGQCHHAAITRAHEALGRLRGAMAHIRNADMVTRTLARREAVSSSQIEGTKATLSELLTYEATRGADGLAPDVTVTERYVTALQHGLNRVRESGRAALTLQLVHELHKILLATEEGQFPVGEYRHTQAWIGSSLRIEDATFVPAPPAQIPGCMAELETSIFQYAQREDEIAQMTIVAQLAVAHAQFEMIHPYHDGNGRTGRLLLPLMLAAEGYPPLYLSGALLRVRRGYYEALASVQLRGDWGAWVELLCHSIVNSCDESISIAEDLLQLVEGWEAELASFRSDSATRRLPRFLLGHPVLSVKQAMEVLGVSQPAANAALNNLLAAGVVTLVDERKWGRVFQATTILERLDQAPG
ncbi:Fic family protein [Lysobacter sp. A286]